MPAATAPVLVNRSRAHELMDALRIDAIVGAQLENVTYLTGLVGWGQHVYHDSFANFGVLTSDRQRGTDLVLGRVDVQSYAADPGFAERVVLYGDKPQVAISEQYQADTAEQQRFLELAASAGRYATAAEAVAGLLEDHVGRSGRVAIDQVGCEEAFLTELRERMPHVELVAGSALLRRIRVVKTPGEIETMREAARLSEAAVETMLAQLRPGMTEREAAHIWHREVGRPGVIPLWSFFGAGPRSAWIICPPGDRELRAGELFLFDVGITYRNYFSDTGGCGVVGEPSRQTLDYFDEMHAIFGDTMDVLRAGVTPNQIYERMAGGVRGSSLPKRSLLHAGHTLGLEARELPLVLGPAVPYDDPCLPPTSDFPFPAGSVLNIEYPMGVQGFGGFQFEKTVVVTESGWEPITGLVEQLHVIAA